MSLNYNLESKYCTNCGTKIENNDQYCKVCNTQRRENYVPQEQNQLVCTGCGKPLHPNDKFCTSCGSQVSNQAYVPNNQNMGYMGLSFAQRHPAFYGFLMFIFNMLFFWVWWDW